MKGKGLFKSIGLIIAGSLVCFSSVKAQDSLTAEVVNDTAIVEEVPVATETAKAEKATSANISADLGRQYFEGSKRFVNGGPSCVSCHNVTNDALIPGGKFSVLDLTDVYSRLGEGITAWLDVPPFPAMVASYQNNPLTEEERASLTAFFKQSSEVKDKQTVTSGYDLFLFGGLGGLIVILIMISLIWMKRKKQMVKKDIFARQSKAWDAKF